MSHERRFRKRDRLRTRADFARVFAGKCSAANANLVVYVGENRLGRSRLGLSVSKRVGVAARRNYVRRRIREAFRTQKEDLPKGLDIVCVALAEAADPRCDIAQSLRSLVLKAAVRVCRGDSKVQPDPDTAMK
jgi:ribonuclease P protein component